jgi:hypothetical protein
VSAVYTQCLDGTVAAIAGLGLQIDGSPAAVAKRKLPTAQESLDTLPLIAVVPSERPTREQPFDTGGANGRMLREYLTQVVAITAGNRDPEGKLDEHLDWRQAISRRFGKPKSLPEVEEIYTTKVEPEVVIDRSAFNQNYNYSAMAIRFICVEPAT